MDKQTLMHVLSQAIASGEVKPEEVLALVKSPAQTEVEPSIHKRTFNFVKALYGIGGIIVFLGIIFLVVQNWDNLGFVSRVAITLGVGVMCYVAGALFHIGKAGKTLTVVFFGLSFLLMPLGIYVFLDGSASTMSGLNVSILISGVMLVVTLVALFAFSELAGLVFSFIFGTWLYYSLIWKFLIDGSFYMTDNILQYVSMVAGVGYYSFGLLLQRSEDEHHRRFAEILFGLATIFVLGSALMMGGVWDVLFIGLVFGAVMLGVFKRHQGLFVISSLFLMAYIIKISTKYFANSLGWPVVLVISGFAIMGVGYLMFHLNRKYIKNNPSSV